MAILVSPGVDIQVIDESFYGSAGPGTVPLIVLATASNKPTPSGDGIAPGTLPENAGKLYQITSQRELAQTFGDPKFYTSAGTPLHGYELNEYGLLTAYQYLGIANRAYVIRGDIDTAQLEPTVFEPRSEAVNGTNWFDVSETSFGLFTNNGNTIPGLAWDNKSPIVVDRRAETEGAVFGTAPFATNTTDAITAPGTYGIAINGTNVNMVHSGIDLSLQDIVDNINTAAIENIEARIFRLSGLSYIVLFNTAGLSITVANNTNLSLLTILGLNAPTVVYQPKRSLGLEGDLAVVVLEEDNLIFQKLKPKNSNGNSDPDAISMWFIVGTNNWKAASPTVVRGTSSPTLPLVTADEFTISTNVDQVHLSDAVNIVVPSGMSSVALIAQMINDALDDAANGFEQDGTTPLTGGPVSLPILAYADNTTLVLVNYSGTDIRLWESNANSSQGVLASLGLPTTVIRGNRLFYATHTKIPQNGVPGDIWVKTTEPNRGASWIVKKYNSVTGQWATITAPFYANDDQASTTLGLSAVAGTLYVQYNLYGTTSDPVASQTIKRYLGAGNVSVVGTQIPGTGSIPALEVNDAFVITASIANGSGFTVNSAVITLDNSVADVSGDVGLDGVVTLINDASADLPGVSATLDSSGMIQIINSNQLSLTLTYIDPVTGSSVQPMGRDPLALMGLEEGTFSRWEILDYEASVIAPTTEAEEGTLWYDPDFRVDILVNDLNQGDEWIAYKNVYPNTDPFGVILGGSPPLTQRDGTPLVEADLWIDTTDLEHYPRMYRYRLTTQSWEEVDNTDQTTPFGVVFADARWNADGQLDGSQEIEDMLVSNFVDPDAPDPRTYPGGMLLFNTRYSTYNVKEWKPDYFQAYVGQELDDSPGDQYSVGFINFPVDTITNANKGRWVTASGNEVDGSPKMGRHAQRIMIVRALASVLAANQDIRSESLFFNLIASPGYPELIDEMVTLNTDKKEIAFIVGDTPARLKPTATDIQAWATNANNAPSNGDIGLTTRNTYVGLYYPWGLSTNLDGLEVVVPPSTVALRTIAYNDIVSYPWFAPAGLRRGLVTNAASVGYITDEDEYQPVLLSPGLRDVLYLNNINPFAFIPNRGLVVFGQKSLHPVESALDRINVVRLINYMRYNLDLLAKPFLFEPNDKITRDEVKATFDRWMGNLISLRAVYDFLVLCDETNNTPARIDRNELWIDIAIQPVKAIEFIYIPIRIRNTGEDLSISV